MLLYEIIDFIVKIYFKYIRRDNLYKYYNDLNPELFEYNGENIKGYLHYNQHGDILDFQFTYKDESVSIELNEDTKHLYIHFAKQKCKEIDSKHND